MVCLLTAPWAQLSVSAGTVWPHNALRHHWLMPISCHFRDCTALLVTSLTHVNGAIRSFQTFTFNFTFHDTRQKMTDAYKVMNPQHFGNDPEDIRIRIRINSEIRIQISDHFWLTLHALAEVCPLWAQSVWRFDHEEVVWKNKFTRSVAKALENGAKCVDL